MFKKARSVPYNDLNLRTALDQVGKFKANFGGTEIYTPLKNIFALGRPEKCAETHIFLLTDGAVFNTDMVVNLVAKNANLQQRVHTFGVGSGASEELIKNCAYKGFGNYYFVYKEQEIEEKVIQSLTKNHLNYLSLNSISLFDQNKNLIETKICEATAPLHDGTAIQLVDLLPPGKYATEYVIEIVDPNSGKKQHHSGKILQASSQSICSAAVLKEFKHLREELVFGKDQICDDVYAGKISNEEYRVLCKDLENKFNDHMLELSIQNQVLHPLTALLVHEKIMKGNTQESEFV